MTNQALLFKTPVALSAARHGRTSIEGTGTYEFCSEINSVPLTLPEFHQAASDYPIVFVGDDTNVSAAVILGLRDGQNLFLSENMEWQEGTYIPAFVRRYPFVFSPSGDRFLLCVDESYAGVNKADRGFRLFTDEGKPSAEVNRALEFLQEYQVQFVNGQRFGARIKELGLLEPMQANVTLDKGSSLTLNGFMTVSREKLNALPVETLGELAKLGFLELIYRHLQSLALFERIRERLLKIEEPELPARPNGYYPGAGFKNDAESEELGVGDRQ